MAHSKLTRRDFIKTTAVGATGLAIAPTMTEQVFTANQGGKKNMRAIDLRFRQVHLDFHTSEHIEGIGAQFDPDEFASTLEKAHVNLVNSSVQNEVKWDIYVYSSVELVNSFTSSFDTQILGNVQWMQC